MIGSPELALACISNADGLMASNHHELRVGCRVCVFPGLRKHSAAVRIAPTEVCEVVEIPLGKKPPEVIAIRRPNGETVFVDADMLWRMNW